MQRPGRGYVGIAVVVMKPACGTALLKGSSMRQPQGLVGQSQTLVGQAQIYSGR